MTTLEARTQIPFGNSDVPVESTSDPVARPFPSLRRRLPLRSPTSAPLGAETEAPTAVHFGSVEAVQRKLRDSVTLDAVERACGETYRRPADRERYFAARMLLRQALSKAVEGRIAPAEWRYREGPYGKLMMADGLPALEFNLSHSGNCVAVAVGKHAPVGIDIECARPDRPVGIIDEILTEGERSRLMARPESQRWSDFVRIWTAKESCAKALGLGLSLDFSTVDVQLEPLRVRLLYPPVGVATDFDVVTTTVTSRGRPYYLTVAKLVGSGSARPAPAEATRAPHA
jgi:4'-phosphopantetheinyl transferase